MIHVHLQWSVSVFNDPCPCRWILLCFKREFPEADTLRMWDACWAHYQTDYFHLFIAVALISVYGEDVVQQDLPADETLLHFSSLAMHMNVHVILKKVCHLVLPSRITSISMCMNVLVILKNGLQLCIRQLRHSFSAHGSYVYKLTNISLRQATHQ